MPNVTRILQPIDELDGIPRDVLERAARFGRHVHLAVHFFNQNILDWDRLDPHLRPYVLAWRKFLAQSGAVVLESEILVHHPVLGYAGQCDAIIRWSGDHVVDVKSSEAIPRSVGPQTAGYRLALLADGHCQRLSRTRYCVHLKPNGEYAVKKLTDSRDQTIFISMLNYHRWKTGE